MHCSFTPSSIIELKGRTNQPKPNVVVAIRRVVVVANGEAAILCIVEVATTTIDAVLPLLSINHLP